MSSRFPDRFYLRFVSCVALLFGSLCAPALAQSRTLRICADPDDLPYSHQNLTGFDNRIGTLVAHEIGRKPEFVWARARRGFIREEFNRGACDVLMGTPVGMRGVLSTEPYYRSTYVFVTRRQDHLQIASFSDPRLNAERIGLQIMEEDLSPPSLPLIRNGHAAQLIGYNSFGEQAGAVISAVAKKQIGIAVVWGPLAGYYAPRQNVALALEPVSPQVDGGIPFVFDIAFGVHRKDSALRDQLSSAIEHRRSAISAILRSYGVPLLPITHGGAS